jgi:hypothetical protein
MTWFLIARSAATPPMALALWSSNAFTDWACAVAIAHANSTAAKKKVIEILRLILASQYMTQRP